MEFTPPPPHLCGDEVFLAGGERSAVGRGGKKIYTDSNSMKGDFDPRTEFLPSSRYLPGIIYRCRDVRTSLEHSRIVKRVLTLYSSRQRFFFSRRWPSLVLFCGRTRLFHLYSKYNVYRERLFKVIYVDLVG